MPPPTLNYLGNIKTLIVNNVTSLLKMKLLRKFLMDLIKTAIPVMTINTINNLKRTSIQIVKNAIQATIGTRRNSTMTIPVLN